MFSFIFNAFAHAIAFFYALVPNYAVSITLLTAAVMLVVYPLTVKQTRTMIALNQLQPEIKRLQALHKDDKQKQSEEMMALYKKHGINPLGGCVPMLLQFPLLIIMFRVISGLTHIKYPSGISRGLSLTKTAVFTGSAKMLGKANPAYLPHTGYLGKMYRDLVASGGQMKSFGIDLSKKASDFKFSNPRILPFLILIVLSGLTQYISTKQIYARNKSNTKDNPQAQQMMKTQYIFIVVFTYIGYHFQGALLFYWVVSGFIRIFQQWYMYTYDKKLLSLTQTLENEIEGEIEQERKAIVKAKRGGGGMKRLGGAGKKPGRKRKRFEDQVR